jgi:hypothetical protein
MIQYIKNNGIAVVHKAPVNLKSASLVLAVFLVPIFNIIVIVSMIVHYDELLQDVIKKISSDDDDKE